MLLRWLLIVYWVYYVNMPCTSLLALALRMFGLFDVFGGALRC